MLNTRSTTRRRTLPAVRLPKKREDRRFGGAVSLLIHLLILLLLVSPLVVTDPIQQMLQGAGGKGPVGGGGGGHRGTGGQTRVAREHVELVTMATQAKPQPPAVKPPPPKLVAVVPPEEKKPELKPELIALNPLPPVAARPLDVAPNVGTGGGSGNDGTNGNGPGRGGGDGSGVGTGRGSGNGPGTGGGAQANYPPSPTEMFLPPYPIPNDVKGFHLIVEFDVDELGRVVSMQFTETKNGGYNKRLAEVFRAFKFRPGTKPDGTPVRMKAQIVVDLY